jgi:hypothetical protein
VAAETFAHRATQGTPDNPVSVKTLRIFLLVLLALLLPIRGAVGAAMMCPEGGLPASSATTTAHPSSHHHHPAQDELKATHHHGQPSSIHHPHSATTAHAGGCNACTSCCSVTPMLSALPAIQAPVDVQAVSFPPLLAPAPTFHCGAQERPPRST